MTQTQGAGKVKYPAPLPLEVAKVDDDAKTLTFKLFSNPGDTTSPKVNKTIRIIDGSEDLRTIIQFKVDSRIVCHGLNLSRGPALHTIMDQLMTASASTAYRTALAQLLTQEHLRLKALARANALVADAAATEAALQLAEDGVAAPAYTTAMVSNAMNAVVAFVSPHKVLEKQKRYMRRHCRKPKEMKTRVFVNHLTRIN
jgi:hypothetical protein